MIKLPCTDCRAFQILPPIKKVSTSDQIISKACEFLDIPEKVLFSKSKFEYIVKARYMVWNLMYNNFRSRYTLTFIARIFKKDHSTVLSGLRKANNYIQTDEDFRYRLMKLHDYVYNHMEYFDHSILSIRK